MFSRSNQKEIASLVIANNQLDQYTMYNCFDAHSEQLRLATAEPGGKQASSLSVSYMKTLREFEKLHHSYLCSRKKKDLLIKKKTHHYTYALLAKGDYVAMACIAHDHTQREAGDILRERISMAKQD